MDSVIKISEPGIEFSSDEFMIDTDGAEFIQFNRDRMAAFDEAIKPMIEFVNKYCTPHDAVVIQQGSAELYSGQMVIPFAIPD